MAHLRTALIGIRRSKVVRHSCRREAEVANLVSKEPTHQDSPTRWNSTHDMRNGAILKRVSLDVTMRRYEGVIGGGKLSDAQWGYIEGVTGFLRLPRQVMTSLSAKRKSTLDLVPLTLTHLLNHCDDGEAGLQAIDLNLTATRMKSELERYRSLLVQEPAIMAAYLNPQLPKPTDPIEQAELMLTIRAVLQRRYSGEMAAQEPQLSEDDGHSLFAMLLGRQSGAVRPTVGDEVDHYISMGVASASSFIDVIQWWIARKELLPAHYKMAGDYLGTPATSTP
jgi:hypothetical protein